MKRYALLTWMLAFLYTPLLWAQEEAPPVVAEEATPDEPKGAKWLANAGVSAVINTGNSENQTVGGNSKVSVKEGKNKVEWKGEVNYGRAKDNNTGVTTTNTKNWKTSLRYDRFLTDPLSVFALGHVGADEPAGFDLRYGGATGMSHQIVKTENNEFLHELGFDYTRELRIANPDENIYSARTFVEYKRKISSWAQFSQGVEALFNMQEGEDVRLNTDTALTTKVTDKVAFKASFQVRLDNVPVPGNKKTDTTTQIGLVIDFL